MGHMLCKPEFNPQCYLASWALLGDPVVPRMLGLSSAGLLHQHWTARPGWPDLEEHSQVPWTQLGKTPITKVGLEIPNDPILLLWDFVLFCFGVMFSETLGLLLAFVLRNQSGSLGDMRCWDQSKGFLPAILSLWPASGYIIENTKHSNSKNKNKTQPVTHSIIDCI